MGLNDRDSYNSTSSVCVSSYSPRIFHPKSGLNLITYMNESAGMYERRDVQLIQRHHIVPVTCDGIDSQIFKPVVYYVDTAIPHPYFSAVMEGIKFWDQAFQYAGYPPDTIVVLPTPESADPFSVDDFGATANDEYSSINYVHWIHRDYRGYSLGQRCTSLHHTYMINSNSLVYM